MGKLHFGNKTRKRTATNIILIILLALIVIASLSFAVIYINSAKDKPITVSDAKAHTVELSLDSGTSYSHAVTENKTFFFNTDSVTILSSSGEVEKNMTLRASTPIISTDGKYALIADKGGKSAHLFCGSKLEKSLLLEENIIIAKVNSNGYALFITEGNVHKHSAIVTSPSGEEIFKWQSGSLSVVSADISNNNRDIALSTVSTDNSVITSNVYMFNITKDKPFTSELIADEVFGVMKFEGSFMYCIGSEKTYIYNDYGKCISTIDYEGRELLNYAMSGGTVALLFSDSTQTANGSVVCSYTAKGDALGQFYLASAARFIDLRDGVIAVDNNRVISVLDSKCREKFQLSTETSLSDFLFLGGSSTAVGVTATSAQIIQVRK